MPPTRFTATIDLSQSAEERCIFILQELTKDPNYEGFDTRVLKDFRLISADGEAGKVVWEFEVVPYMCQKAGTLHGGAAATIMDNVTSTALFVMARPGFLDGGHVSRTITMTYLRPVPMGATMRVEAEAVAGGKSLAHCRGVIKTLDGKPCILCAHDKAVLPPLKSMSKL